MRPFERDYQKLSAIQKRAAVTLFKMSTVKKLWAGKCGGQNRNFLPLSTDSDCKTKNWYV